MNRKSFLKSFLAACGAIPFFKSKAAEASVDPDQLSGKFEVKFFNRGDHYSARFIYDPESLVPVGEVQLCGLDSRRGNLSNAGERRSILNQFFEAFTHVIRREVFPADTLRYTEVADGGEIRFVCIGYPGEELGPILPTEVA